MNKNKRKILSLDYIDHDNNIKYIGKSNRD